MNLFSRIFPEFKQYKLSYRLLMYVVLCSSFFALVATAIQLYLDYRRDMSALNQSFNYIEKSYLQSIAASTYRIDKHQLTLGLEGALRLPDIVYLEVKEKRGNNFHTHAHGNPNVLKSIRREFPLEYIRPSGEQVTIGTLIAIANLDGVYQRLWSRVWTVLITNMAKTFLASACILAIIYFLITRHLTQMASFTQRMELDKHNRLLTLDRKSRDTNKPDELEQVVKAINDLQERATTNIRERRQAELKYRTVADFTYDWEYWESADGKLHYVSPSCERISGYSIQKYLENPTLFREIIVSEDKNEWDRHYHDARKEFRPRELQFRIQRKDGEVRWIEHVCQPVYDDQGNPLGFRASNRDITDRKLAEIQLRDAYSKIDKLKNQLEAEKAYLQEEIKFEHNFDSIIGNSSGIKYVLFKIEQVAATDSSVLILGETGTGKELVARAIHNSSMQHNRPLIKVNCAALPTNLIESELFGHEPGAYTGAQNRRVGHFETADGSSIFLDEIGELPLDLQTKLLGVLQDGEFQRLGSSQSVKVNVRVIAATNRDLEKEVRKRRFRQDLFYRLNVFPITVPPLRERIKDIPLLVEFLMEKSCKRLGKSIKIIPKSVMKKLEDYFWPGNVRELENVIERAVINSSGSKLRLVDDLSSKKPEKSLTFETLESVELEHIKRVLEHTNWKVSGKNSAAEILGLKRSTLRARMRKLGIQKP